MTHVNYIILNEKNHKIVHRKKNVIITWLAGWEPLRLDHIVYVDTTEYGHKIQNGT